jgi:hypothetical protein
MRNIPQIHCSISSASGNTGTLGGPGHGKDAIFLSCAGLHPIADKVMPGHGVPHLDGAVIASQGDARAIRGPGQRIDGPSVAGVENEQFPSLRVPDLDSTIVAPRSDAGVIG